MPAEILEDVAGWRRKDAVGDEKRVNDQHWVDFPTRRHGTQATAARMRGLALPVGGQGGNTTCEAFPNIAPDEAPANRSPGDPDSQAFNRWAEGRDSSTDQEKRKEKRLENNTQDLGTCSEFWRGGGVWLAEGRLCWRIIFVVGKLRINPLVADRPKHEMEPCNNGHEHFVDLSSHIHGP